MRPLESRGDFCRCVGRSGCDNAVEVTDEHDDGNDGASGTRRAWLLPRWKAANQRLSPVP